MGGDQRQAMTDETHRLADAEPATQPEDAPRDENDDATEVATEPASNPNHNLNESADKARANVGITRGTGTRDQEKYDLKARGDDAEAAAEELDELLSELESRDVFQRIRDLQHTPTNDDE